MKIFYFGAPWCGQCKTLKPKVEEECKTRGIALQIVDVEEEDGLCDIYGIKNVPTIILVKNGEIVARASGGGAWDEVRKHIV